MKYCSKCGKEVMDEAVVCPNCGCKIEGQNNGNLSALSIVGFVFAFLMPIVGLILSIIAYNNAKKDENERCRSFAKAGIIVSICVWIVCFIIYLGIFACAAAAMTAV